MSLVLFVGLATSLGAQGKTAQDIMARAEREVYGSGQGEATFVSVMLNAKGKEESRQTGKIYLQGESFRLEYGDIVATFADKTLIYHDNQEETLTYSTPTSEELLQINPLYFLRSRGKGFDVKLQTAPKGATSQTLVYTPQGKSNIKQVSVSYDAKTSRPQNLVIFAKDNSRLVVVVSTLRPAAKPYAKTLFTLSAKDYPKSEVIDLR